MRNQYKRYLFLFCSLAALLLGLSGTGVVFAQSHARLASPQKGASQTCGAWSVVPSPNPNLYGNDLYGVAAVSANDVWAVGYSYSSTGVYQTLIEQWNGTSWSVVASPNVGSSNNKLLAVAAVSASDVWAVGDSSNTTTGAIKTLIEHWDGTSWSVVASPNVSSQNYLLGVAAASTNDVWAVGYSYNTSTGVVKALTLNWNGTSWSRVPSPNAANLSAVAAVSTNDIWGAGYYYNTTYKTNGTATINWNGTKWSIVPSPNVDTSNELFSVAADSASDVWSVGYYYNNSAHTWMTLTLHWNGTSWSVVPSPNPNPGPGYNFLDGVAAVSTSDAWAVGAYYNSTTGHNSTATLNWNGASWSVVSSPSVGSFDNHLYGVAAVSASDVWAVGYNQTSTNATQTLIEFYC